MPEGGSVSGKAWLRILLCGMVAGVVWFALSAILLGLVAGPFVAWTQSGAPRTRWSGAIDFLIDLAMGIWATWLYASITPRYGARPRTALIAGVAWWFLKTLQSAKWAGLGLIPTALIPVPLLTTLVAVSAASLVGAWLYDGLGRRAFAAV